MSKKECTSLEITVCSGAERDKLKHNKRLGTLVAVNGGTCCVQVMRVESGAII